MVLCTISSGSSTTTCLTTIIRRRLPPSRRQPWQVHRETARVLGRSLLAAVWHALVCVRACTHSRSLPPWRQPLSSPSCARSPALTLIPNGTLIPNQPRSVSTLQPSPASIHQHALVHHASPAHPHLVRRPPPDPRPDHPRADPLRRGSLTVRLLAHMPLRRFIGRQFPLPPPGCG